MASRRSSLQLSRVGIVVIVLLFGLGLASTPTSAGASSVPTGFYLDVGGSSSLGYEPTGLLTKDGALFDKPSDNGYANDVVKLEAPNVALALTKLGCPGETVATLLGEKDHCYKLPVTQMLLALKFLGLHHDDTGVVSIDIGYNDVQPCIETKDVEVGCVEQAKDLVNDDLPKLIAKLKGAAGPNVHFVGLEYPDPFLARYLQGPSEKSYATQTLNVITELNQDLSAIYTKAGVGIVNVPSAFLSSDSTPTRTAGGDVVPTNVAEVCDLTFMCRAYPWGPDDHPNNSGYEVIARQIVRVLPTSW
jgi:lysophospholipase L1-like esterase